MKAAKRRGVKFGRKPKLSPEQVEHARDQMPFLQREVKRLDTTLRELWELQRKRGTLQRLERGEMLIALECARASGLPIVATMSFRPLITQSSDHHGPAECARAMAENGAIAVGANCEQEPERMLPLIRQMRAAVKVPIAAQPAAFAAFPQAVEIAVAPADPAWVAWLRFYHF